MLCSALASGTLRLRGMMMGAAMCLAFGAGAHAQQCQTRTHFRIVNNMSEAQGLGELRLDSGWVAGPGVNVLPGQNTVTNKYGCVSQADVVATADYGRLAFKGTGSAHNALGNGCFLWIDEWIGGQPKAMYQDTIKVSSPTLPAGTPVTLEFVLELDGSAQVQDTTPTVYLSASLDCYGPFSPASSVNLLLGAAGRAVVIKNTTVGATLSVTGKLSVSMYASGVQQATPTSATMSADLVAFSRINVLTAGATITSCSGSAYHGCAADFNDDGFIDIYDFIDFVTCFEGGACPSASGADFNGDGFADIFDFTDFVTAFEGGC